MGGRQRGFTGPSNITFPVLLWQIAIILALLSSPEALRPNIVPKKPQHTLDDKLRPFLTAADVAHNDVQRFIWEGLEHMQQLGVKLSKECERRYGYSFISNQQVSFFRLCKSDAYLKEDGTFGNVSQNTPLSRLRRKVARKQALIDIATGKDPDAALAAEAAAAVAADVPTRRQLRQELSKSGRQHMESGPSARHHALEVPEAVGAMHGSTRQLQAANSSSGLTYKLIQLVNAAAAARIAKKAAEQAAGGGAADVGGGDPGGGSDVYNDDDGVDASTEQAATEAIEQALSGSGSGGGSGTDEGGGAGSTRPPRPQQIAYGAINYFEKDDGDKLYSVEGKPWKSSVNCYLNPVMPRNLGYKDAQLLCVGRNIVLDTCALYDGQNEGFEVRFPLPKAGALQAACTMNIRALNERDLTKGRKNRMWWNAAVDNAYETVQASCDPSSGKVVDHPVAFILRDRYTHTLHELEVLTTIFTSLAVLDLPEIKQMGLQIVIADQMPHASYRSTYAAISYPYRLRHLAENPYPNGTCFRTALFINAFTNSMAFNANPNTSTCFSPIMVGVHKWLRTLHKELDPLYLAKAHHHASETGGIIRRSVVWASRRNLEALRLTSGVGMTSWQSARMVPNENEVVVALQRTIMEWNSKDCLLHRYYSGDQALTDCRSSNVQFDLVFGEFSDWPYYPDQLMTIYRTGVLMGVHGAALTFVTSTALGESALLELAGEGWESTQTGNMLNLFPSLSSNVGAYYEQVRYPGPDIDTSIASAALVRAMDEVSKRIIANQAKARHLQKAHFNDQYNFDVMFPHACPTSVKHKIKRFITNHPVQMTNATGEAGVVVAAAGGPSANDTAAAHARAS